MPVYQQEIARNMYALHVCYIVYMAYVAGEVHRSMGLGGLSDDEVKMLVISMETLRDEGLVEIKEVDIANPIEKT